MHHFCTFACLALVIHSWHSLTHSYIHSLAHSFIHSFIRLTYVDSDVCCPRLLLFLFEFLLNNCTKKGVDGREARWKGKGQAGGGCVGGVGVAYRDALIAYLVKCCHGSPTRQTRHKVRYTATVCSPYPSPSRLLLPALPFLLLTLLPLVLSLATISIQFCALCCNGRLIQLN